MYLMSYKNLGANILKLDLNMQDTVQVLICFLQAEKACQSAYTVW